MKTRQLHCFVFAALVAGAHGSAGAVEMADTAASAGEAVATTSSPSVGLTEIVVTARRRTESLETVPVAVTAFVTGDLEEHKIVNMSDLGQLTPSLTFQQNPYSAFATLPGIRGQRASDTILSQTPSVGIYVDDVYQATTFGVLAAGMQDVSDVEVLKGPQGTLYGRNTTGGAIKITTALPDYNGFSGSGTLGVGNYHEKEEAGSMNAVLIDNRLALRLSVDHLYHSGFGRDLTNGRPLEDMDTWNTRAALRFDPTDNLELILRGDWTAGRSGGVIAQLGALEPPFSPSGTPNISPTLLEVGLATGALTYADLATHNFAHILGGEIQAYHTLLPYLNTGYDEHYSSLDTSHTSSSGGSLTVTDVVNHYLTLKSISAYRVQDQYGVVDADSTPFQILEGPAAITSLHQLTQELQLIGTGLEDKLKYTGGYYYFRLKGVDASYPELELPLLNPFGNPVSTVDWLGDKNQAVYGQSTYAVTPTIRLTGGLRWTTEDTSLTAQSTAGGNCNLPPPAGSGGIPCIANFASSFNNTSYTGGVDWSPTDDVLLYVRTSRGFKAGGQNQRGSVVGGFGAFAPEVVTDYEIGAKAEWFERRLRVNTALYYSDYKNIQRTVLDVTPTGQAITEVLNAAAARISGLEFELAGKPTDVLTVRLGFAYTDPKYRTYVNPFTGADLSHDAFQNQPRWQGNSSISYSTPVPFGTVTTTLDYSYQSRVFFEPDNLNIYSNGCSTQGGYGLLNARAAFLLKTYNLQLAAWAKNIANKEYIVGAGDLTTLLGFGQSYLSAPRTFGFEIKKSF